jgi:hypothetical protein
MEHLTKQQITLLCLLVALFTSITTSVITASLFDQTSGGAPQTLYRVVEKTIKEVIQKEPVAIKQSLGQSSVTTAPKQEPEKQVPLETIVARANQSLVSVWNKDRKGNSQFLSNAVVIGDKNLILVFDGQNIFENRTYYLKLSNGTEIEIGKAQTTIFGMVALTLLNESASNQLVGIKTGNLKSLSLGSNVIAVGSKEGNNVVSTGIITEFPYLTEGDKKNVAVTDIKLFSPLSGWVLLDTAGNMVGIVSAGNFADTGTRYAGIEQFITALPGFF